ncbi:hypothetical protein V6N11_021639 [Hibiscus sabdariffa]|uniref:Retrotransposon gag domain-containing protein n=1 Tax=Hibiscus sabdariffa TaxID=183260 RepID=A0ABR2PBX7_9ROSI
MYQGDEPIDGQQDQPAGGNAGGLARWRAIRDHLTRLLDDLNPVIVAPEIQEAHFELKPVVFNMLYSIGQFGGSHHEDARQHIRAFLEVYDSFRQQGVHEDVLRLKLFPYSLRDQARAWLSGVPAGSLESWADLYRSFLMRYNPPNMHTQLRNDIAYFRQADYESMMMLDASANGTLLEKSPKEAFEILDKIANNDYQFPTSRLGSGRRTPGRLDLDNNDSVLAQLSAIKNFLKNLQKPSDVCETKALSCVHCEGNHHANDCPIMHEQASYMGNFNRNSNNPYSNTYNQGWRQHPNFSWNNKGGANASSSSRQQNMNAPLGFQANMPWHSETQGNASESNNNSLEATMQEFISTTKTMLQEHSASIKHQGNDSPIEDDKGEKLDNEKTEEKHVNAAASAAPQPTRDEVRPTPPFPQRLKKHKEDLQFKKVYIVTKKRQVESYETVVVAYEYCAGRIDLPMKKKDQASSLFLVLLVTISWAMHYATLDQVST